MDGEWAGEFAVETNGLTKRFGKRTVVDHVDLRVPRGSVFLYLRFEADGEKNRADSCTFWRLLVE